MIGMIGENGSQEKIRHFTDLRVWKEGHNLALGVYRETKNFPKEERFGISSQMQRAAVSITSNIAEGFGRVSLREKLNFYTIARGSLLELENQILLSADLGFLSHDASVSLRESLTNTHKLINALISSTRSRL